MSIGLYQSASTLTALERWQDAVTQNITSSQVAGYKKRTVKFSVVEAGEVLTDTRQKIGHGEGQGMFFPKLGYGIDFKTGETSPTRRDLDLALQGEGFFEVQMGEGQRGYTRAGELRLKPDRTLVTAQGQPILNTDGQPIQLLPRGDKLIVNNDGTLTQGGVSLGRVSVVKFENIDQLVPVTAGMFVQASGPKPGQVEKPEVIQGYLENSNVSALREMVDLVNIARAYEANQKLIQGHDQLLSKTLEALG